MSNKEVPLVVSVILNTNRCDDTLQCLNSLKNTTYANHQIIVLDNGSTDGSIEAIEAAYPEVTVLSLEHNLGYAGNNNVGIEAALSHDADWIFVLNEDVILADESISKLVEAGESDDHVGIVGPLVYHYDAPELIQSAGGTLDANWFARHRGENKHDEGQFVQNEPVDWISGCAIMVRRGVVETVGALDERFFYYWEETEWCTRARSQGWKVVFVPSAKIWHKGVQKDYKPSVNVTYYWARNWLFFLSKQKAPVRAWAAAFLVLARTLISWSLKPRWKDKKDHRDALWQGMRDFISRRWGIRPT
jgi:hypothetical protein